jgi:hypothetical protein
LLVNAVTYGTIDSDGRFVPPTAEHDPALRAATRAAYDHQFEVMLDACQRQGMKVIPCLIGFDACKPRASPGGGGRSALVTDSAVRERFFDDVLELLLERSRAYRDVIYAWEVFSEPVWPVRRLVSVVAACCGWWNMTPHVSRQAMTEFLHQGIDRINRAGFLATIGHNFESTYSLCGIGCGDERLFPVPPGARYLRQFHWYPDGITRRAVPAHARTQSIIGEFSARLPVRRSSDPERWAWPDLEGRDCAGVYQAVLHRLYRLAEARYRLACLWPTEDHRAGSNSNLDFAAERAVRDFVARNRADAPEPPPD